MFLFFLCAREPAKVEGELAPVFTQLLFVWLMKMLAPCQNHLNARTAILSPPGVVVLSSWIRGLVFEPRRATMLISLQNSGWFFFFPPLLLTVHTDLCSHLAAASVAVCISKRGHACSDAQGRNQTYDHDPTFLRLGSR